MKEPAPEQGTTLGSLLDHVFQDCVPRSFTTIGPGYLAFVPGGGLYPAALADFIADTTNRFTGIWQAAPALVQLEANALDWLREWMGFPGSARGLFTTGGSMATFNAIVCARERERRWTSSANAAKRNTSSTTRSSRLRWGGGHG